MLVLPMRSQDPSPNRQSRGSYSTTLPIRHREPSPQTIEFRRQLAGAMMSIMPPTRPSAPRRPKLSLQTSLPPDLNLDRPASGTDSPTVRNTQANAFEAPPPTPSSAIQPQFHFPTFPPTSLAPLCATHSPYPQGAPYVLPLGTYSILRNSPLPKRHVSATSARTPRRMFPPVKRVLFQENLTEVAPTPVIEDPSDTEADAPATEAEQRRRREVIEAEDGHATCIQGRRKRRREWVWRPVEDDVLAPRDMNYSQDSTTVSDNRISIKEDNERYFLSSVVEERAGAAAAALRSARSAWNLEERSSSKENLLS